MGGLEPQSQTSDGRWARSSADMTGFLPLTVLAGNSGPRSRTQPAVTFLPLFVEKLLVTAKARRYQLSGELARTGISDDDSAAVRFAALDESHPVLDVGVGRRIVGAQTLRDPLQLCPTVGGPQEVLDAVVANTVPPRRAF